MNYKDCKFIGIDLAKAYKPQHRDWCTLRTSSNWFIGNTLIPFFFYLLNFYSKKKKDYQEWKSIFYLKEKGQHHTDEGLNLIKLILSQMNNNRLSSLVDRSVVDEARLHEDISAFLKRPSNYQVTNKGGWIIYKQKYLNKGGVTNIVQIIDEEGNVVQTFLSMKICGNVLGKNPNTLTRGVRTNHQFNWSNKLCTIKKL